MESVLKRIRLHGFKTFAQRTEIDLEGHLTVLVGPNGCGKSNLVDALVWGLGEPNVRSLRAGSPTEVIFAGSSTQKPLGMAEVSLWFDNQSRWLPLDADEVQITRRLYRSGEWECWINKTPCRLKDVADLFAGTGLGRGGYAIIRQGEIEGFLAAAPEERRLWIEEAAGIALYRHRRRETLRDLDSAHLHLQRVEDVLNELEHQRAPLREEAERARRYRALREEIRHLERAWLLQEWRQTQEQLRTLTYEREAVGNDILQTEAKIAQLERETENRGAAIAALEAEMDTLRGVQSGLLNALERLEGRWNALQERRRTLLELRQVIEEEIADRQERTQRSETTRRQLQARLKTAHAAFQKVEARCHELTTQKQQIATHLEKQQQAWQTSATAHIRQAVQQQQLHELQLQQEKIAAEAEKLRQESLRWQHELEEARQKQSEALRIKQDAEAERHPLERELHRKQEEYRQALEVKAALTARLRALQASLAAGEGAAPGTRHLLQALQRGELKGTYQTVAQLIRVPAQYRLAIEAALGGSLHDLITTTESEARQAIEWLKRHAAGRATFLPLDLLPRIAPNSSRPRTTPHPLASELVECEPVYRPAIEWLLGRVLVVPDLETAVQLLREWRQRSSESPSFARLVTLEGEVVQPSGVMTGGRSAKERAGALTLKAECDQLEAELETQRLLQKALEAELKGLQARWQESQTRLQTAEQALESAREQVAQLETCWREWQTQLQAAEAQLQQGKTELARLQASLQSVPEQSQQEVTEEQLHALRASYEEIVAQLAHWNTEKTRLINEQQESHARLQQEDQILQQLQVSLASQQARLQAIEAEIDQIETEVDLLSQERESLHAQLEQTESQMQARREDRKRRLEEGFHLTEQLKQVRAEQGALIKRERDLDLQIARLEVHRTELLERWQAEFGEEEMEGVEGEVESLGFETRPQLGVYLQRLRRELQAMGEVNLGAAEEYERLSERYETLALQREDLLQTRARLSQALRDLDRHARQQFEATFEAVREAFRVRFERLFEGGNADLILTNPSDPLSSGVLIEAQPPGKRRQRLELLSGGERAMTAAALLFAFLEVHPSPLCVLDEVDAALDGRNVERFVEHLQELASHSQTLIVTHNPVTIGSANHWIGITAEAGISKVIPYHFQSREALKASP